MLLQVEPINPVQQREPFDSPEWVFETKFDGFRGIAYVEGGECRLVSRKGHAYKRFQSLRKAIAAELRVKSAILDGEIVCLDGQGRSQFYDLMFRRGQPYFYAFDLLWLNGVDLRELPLLERKTRLKGLVPERPSLLLYLDHIEGEGVDLFHLACGLDLEGIVAKPKASVYRSERKPWIKVKNPSYSQAEGRRELFDSQRTR
jgi:bifunctional non-homologous end joining protein LigD